MTAKRTGSLFFLVDAANDARRQPGAQGGKRDEELQLEFLFRTSEQLAVYGSLAPGRQNHHIVAPLGGTWSEGVVEGDLFRHESGPAKGYAGLRPRAGGPAVPVDVLTSADLPRAWPDLDAFEGPAYRRVLVPVWSEPDADGPRRLLTVANLYEAATTD
jgi:gamma-glutamylcyclotransferase (GGCT)/AIG2-like uncharacterized protein YtfP